MVLRNSNQMFWFYLYSNSTALLQMMLSTSHLEHSVILYCCLKPWNLQFFVRRMLSFFLNNVL